MWKVKAKLGKPVTAHVGKFRLMYVLLASNDDFNVAWWRCTLYPVLPSFITVADFLVNDLYVSGSTQHYTHQFPVISRLQSSCMLEIETVTCVWLLPLAWHPHFRFLLWTALLAPVLPDCQQWRWCQAAKESAVPWERCDLPLHQTESSPCEWRQRRHLPHNQIITAQCLLTGC